MSVIQGDARHLPLPDESVDLIVTSPPYFALRSYTDDGEHYAGQIGSEPTWQEFIGALVDCTREWVRVLKPSGSLFVDLGDKYSGGGRSTYDTDEKNGGRGGPRPIDGFQPKSLMLLPERYRIACVDDLGLIARAVLVWSKPNGLPESVTDRVRRSHEDWVHLTRRPRYYSAVDEIRTEHAAASRSPVKRFDNGTPGRSGNGLPRTSPAPHPLGALPGSVWSIPTEPLTLPNHLGVDHFAAFPSEWPRRLILGWSPPGICVECGEGRRPVVDSEYVKVWNHTPSEHMTANGGNNLETFSAKGRGYNEREITGYACDCPTPDAPTRPSVVLDPFGGTGTTAAVAQALGRTGISVDLSHDYCRVARWRAQDTALAGKVQGRMWKERQTTLDLGGAA